MGAKRKRTKTKRPAKLARIGPRKKETKTGGLEVVIVRTHQDEISWGAYFQLEPVKNVNASSRIPPGEFYKLEVSWQGNRLRPPRGVDPIIDGSKRSLFFLIAGPGYPGSRVLVRLRFSPASSFYETVTGRAWRIEDDQQQKPNTEVIDFVPGRSNWP